MEDDQIIEFYIENGLLLSPELLNDVKKLEIPLRTDFSVINKEVLEIIKNKIPISVEEFEKSVVLKEKHKNPKMHQKFLEYINEHRIKDAPQMINELARDIDAKSISIAPQPAPQQLATQDLDIFRKDFMTKHKINLVMNYDEKSHKRTVADFVNHFNSRYKELEKILRGRSELQNLTSIARINAKKEKDTVALIGFVYEKALTKKNNLLLTLEDPTGFIKVVVRNNKEELFNLANEIQLDEVIGVVGNYDKLVFANSMFLPDIPLTKELKKSPEEGYFVVIGDPQVGNKLFLEKEFKKFIAWLNGHAGSDAQKDIASKVKYLFIIGDLAEGVGIYPDQEYDLSIIDIYDQYKAFAEYVKMMPQNLPIFICPGNHDVGRMSEPQPGFHDEYTRPVWTIPNVIPVSNPSLINVYSQPETGFDGFDVLLYHGYSFFYYFEHVPNIRQKGGAKRADLVMKYLLQRRHLAPSHTSNLYIPDPKRDHLTIDKVPDFFFTGHIHRASVNNYKNVTCINASCWVSKSDEQERRGLEPQPARIFLVNMNTREIKIMNFLSKEDQEKETKDSTGMSEPVMD